MKHLYIITLLGIIAGMSLHAADIANEIENAIERRDREGVRQLINPDNINIKLRYGRTTPLDYAIEYDDVIALDLIEGGANVNATDQFNTTPLHTAAYYDSPTVVRKLLEAGALTSTKNADGYTPLDLAKKYGCLEVIPLLESYENAPDIKEPECK